MNPNETNQAGNLPATSPVPDSAPTMMQRIGGMFSTWWEQYKQHFKDQMEKQKQIQAGNFSSTPDDVNATQKIVVYNRGDVMKAFQADAKRLAKQGWRVQSQVGGGQQSVGVARALTFGLAAGLGGRKIKEMTVIYVRDAAQ